MANKINTFTSQSESYSYDKGSATPQNRSDGVARKALCQTHSSSDHADPESSNQRERLLRNIELRRDSQGFALLDVMRLGQYAVIETYLDRNPHLIYHSDTHGNTLLHYALQLKNPENRCQFIELLLDKKCDPTAVNEEGLSPIHIAQENPALATALALLLGSV